MTSLQIDDVLGFGELLRGAATEYKTKLMAAKNPHDPTTMITDTTASGKDVGEKKAEAKVAVDEGIRLNGIAEDVKNALYSDLSNWCNLMANTLGQQSVEGKRILAIRVNLKGTGPKAAAAAAKTPAK